MSAVSFETLDKPTHSFVVYKTGTRTLLGYVWRNAEGWWAHLGDGHKVQGPFSDRVAAGEDLLRPRARISAAS